MMINFCAADEHTLYVKKNPDTSRHVCVNVIKTSRLLMNIFKKYIHSIAHRL